MKKSNVTYNETRKQMTRLDPDIKGYRPSMLEAVRGKCAQCACGYLDGRIDCLHTHCSLYSRMPYRRHVPNFLWIFGPTSRLNSLGKHVRPWGQKYINDMKRRGFKLETDYIRTVIIDELRARVPMPDMIRAKCFWCMSDYFQGGQEPGMVECNICDCSLYYWTPYRTQRPCYDWMFDAGHTRKHINNVIVENISREAYIEQLYG